MSEIQSPERRQRRMERAGGRPTTSQVLGTQEGTKHVLGSLRLLSRVADRYRNKPSQYRAISPRIT